MRSDKSGHHSSRPNGSLSTFAVGKGAVMDCGDGELGRLAGGLARRVVRQPTAADKPAG